MTKLLPFLIAALIALSSNASARSSCLSHAEAKKVYRGAYLYWHKLGRDRCWSDRRGGRGYQFVPAKVMASLPPKRQETIHIEPQLYWTPEWSWVFDILRDNNPMTFNDYPSTFPPGEEPDVWPLLPEPSRNDGIGIVVACAAAAMLFGTMLHKWRMTRIRIT